MSFIVFNTLKKAKHYLKYLESLPLTDDDLFHGTTKEYSIKNNLIILTETSDAYCSSSDPSTGYICCSGNYVTYKIVIGRIKSS